MNPSLPCIFTSLSRSVTISTAAMAVGAQDTGPGPVTTQPRPAMGVGCERWCVSRRYDFIRFHIWIYYVSCITSLESNASSLGQDNDVDIFRLQEASTPNFNPKPSCPWKRPQGQPFSFSPRLYGGLKFSKLKTPFQEPPFQLYKP